MRDVGPYPDDTTGARIAQEAREEMNDQTPAERDADRPLALRDLAHTV